MRAALIVVGVLAFASLGIWVATGDVPINGLMLSGALLSLVVVLFMPGPGEY